MEKFDRPLEALGVVPELLHGFVLSEGAPLALVQSMPELWVV